jgi:hypothetical protein
MEKLNPQSNIVADKLGLQRGSVGNWEYGKGISRRNAVRLVGLAKEAGLSRHRRAPVDRRQPRETSSLPI